MVRLPPDNLFGTTGGTTYSWTNDNTAIGLAPADQEISHPLRLLIPSNTTVSANITVTAG